jgi:thymidylate kinase
MNKNSVDKSMTICFLGPDGAGKSTIIEIIRGLKLFENTYYFHLKPIKVSSDQKRRISNEPHKYEPYSKFTSAFKLLFFLMQYNLGWLANIVPLNKRTLVIFDRYYDDLLVDPRRYRYGGNFQLAKFVGRLIPKPDIYFILTANAEIIYKRKQEIPFEVLENQITKYKNLADNNRYYNIDVNRSPDSIAFEIKNIIIQKINERQ